MFPLDLVKLTPLMDLTEGRPEVVVGMLDGPVVTDHPDLADGITTHEAPDRASARCAQASGAACSHGTFVAGILGAKRDSPAPAICPGCTLMVHPVFKETTVGNGMIPSASPGELAAAIVECVDAGARVLNLSVGFEQPYTRGEHGLGEALDHAMRRRVIVAVAAGNQGTLGSSAITSHPWVVPVAACDLRGRPVSQSNLGSSISRRGLRAPGDAITSLGAEGRPLTLGGTSVATPFVAGAIALLWSVFPQATAIEVKSAMMGVDGRRSTVVPPLLDAWSSYGTMAKANA